MKSSTEIDIRLDTLKQLVTELAKAIGPACEVILHDLRTLDSSCIAMSGNVTGRRVGAPITDLGLRVLRRGDSASHVINYSSTTADGKHLRSSTLIMRDSKGKPIAFVCINFDLSTLTVLREFIDLSFPTGLAVGDEAMQDNAKESFPGDVGEVLRATVSSVLKKLDKPISIMNKQDKLKAVELLDQAGIFAIKKAPFYVASVLNASRYTIYNYLNEVRQHSSSTMTTDRRF